MRFFEAHGVHRRQVRGYGLPAIAAVLADPEGTGRRSERQHVSRVVDIERMTEHEVVRMRLRQPCRQGLEGPAAISGAIDDDSSVHGIAFLIFHCGDEPGNVGVAWMNRYWEAERRGLHVRDFGPRRSTVSRAEDSIVMLHP